MNTVNSLAKKFRRKIVEGTMFSTERQSCLSLKLVLGSMAVDAQGDEVFCRVVS